MPIVQLQRNDMPPRASCRRLAPIGPLATLPVFLCLSGRRAVVIGGTEAAAWKAQLLAAAGADVEVFADAQSEAMRSLLDRGTENGSLRRGGAGWTFDYLLGAAIVVADAETEEDALAIRDAAKAAGVPVNVIDRPSHCDFRFGSIVNRSPVVIGISTDGAAPILGQAIRRRIEAVLPPWLSEWGTLAGRLRAAVTALLEPGAQRRRFWEAFAETAFRSAPGGSAETRIMRQARQAASADVFGGRVTVVGTVPGEAEHLTLKAVRALQSADVILFDESISADVLELARRESRRISLGPRDRRSVRQTEVSAAMMVDFTRDGKHVVLLETGDPMGSRDLRADIAGLLAHRIPVDIVPGITVRSGTTSATIGPGRTTSKVARPRPASQMCGQDVVDRANGA